MGLLIEEQFRNQGFEIGEEGPTQSWYDNKAFSNKCNFVKSLKFPFEKFTEEFSSKKQLYEEITIEVLNDKPNGKFIGKWR